MRFSSYYFNFIEKKKSPNTTLGGGTTIKRTKEVLAIFIVFLLCFSFINNVISTNALAEETVQDPPEEPSGNLGLLGSFIKLLGGLNAMMRQPIQFFLMSPKASPAAIHDNI